MSDRIRRFKNGEGLVAVLYSRGFGAGWSTWNNAEMQEYLVFDRSLVGLVLAGKRDEAAVLAEARFAPEYVCVLGADGLAIEWVPEGGDFEIEEYDGKESVHVIGEHNYLTA